MICKQLSPLLILCLFIFSFTALSQDDDIKPITAEVTVTTNDEVYKSLRGLSNLPTAFGGEYISVNNLVFKKDAATFTLRDGSVYFLTNSDRRTIGAVFFGNGSISLTPPVEVERKHLSIFSGSNNLTETFSTLTMFFTDGTADQIKKANGATMATDGAEAAKALSEFKDKESVYKNTFNYNITSRMLSDFYSPDRRGFFNVFIDGSRFGKLHYSIDPLGQAQTYPEQVQLLSYGGTTGGIWTAFHTEEEIAKGTAVSWADRRIYDIKHHELDVAVTGTRLTISDQITLEIKENNIRFLPFDLYRSLRVTAVKDEAGNPLVYIQEKKDEDADFGIILPKPVSSGEKIKLTVEFNGTEALREAGSGNFILVPRSTWYPNNPLSAFGDRATFNLKFTYPRRYIMIGVGEKIGEDVREGNNHISQWTSGQTELAVAGFNYGDFRERIVKDEATGINLEVYSNRVLPNEIRQIQMEIERIEASGGRVMANLGSLNTGSMANNVLVDAQNATRIYSAYFGPSPFKRIAMTQQPASNFGQAWPSLVFMPYTAFFSDTHRVQLFGIRGGTQGFWNEVGPHEVAHQWWGHAVGWTSYRDQWMSEGFSEFSTSLYVQLIKKDTAKFISYWEAQRKQIIEATPATNGIKPYTVGPLTQGYRLNSAKTGRIAQNMIYPKGAYVLHMIRMMMYDHRNKTGDARFQKMMTDFVQSHFNKDISTNDFKLAVEKHITPEMDIDKNGKMDWFFDKWVYGTEMPNYHFEYSLSTANNKTVINGKVTQSGVSDDFAMPVPIYVDYGQGWSYIGRATLVGNRSMDLNNIELPGTVRRVAISALNDVLADKVDIVKK